MSRRQLRTWWSENGLRVVGVLFVAAGVGTTVWVAIVGASSEGQDSKATEGWGLNIALVLIGGLFQLGSAYSFARSGRPGSTHAGASVRRLVNLARRCEDVSRMAVNSQGLPVSEMRVALSDLSARLNYVAQDAFASVEDWTSFNGDARRKAEDMERQALLTEEGA